LNYEHDKTHIALFRELKELLRLASDASTNRVANVNKDNVVDDYYLEEEMNDNDIQITTHSYLYHRGITYSYYSDFGAMFIASGSSDTDESIISAVSHVRMISNNEYIYYDVKDAGRNDGKLFFPLCTRNYKGT
jgi:hypothetical protein